MSKPSYDSPEWYAQKARIIEARGELCQDCGISSHWVELHHTYYEPGRVYDNYPDDALKILCPDCHELTTEALVSLNYTFGRFTGSNIVDISSAIQEAISETGDPNAIANWMKLCLSDIRNAQIEVAL